MAAHGHVGIIVKEHFAEDVTGGKAFAHILEKVHANAYGMASKTALVPVSAHQRCEPGGVEGPGFLKDVAAAVEF